MSTTILIALQVLIIQPYHNPKYGTIFINISQLIKLSHRRVS